MLEAIQSDSTEAEGGDRRNTISPSGRARRGMAVVREGQERNGGKEEGVQVGVKLVGVCVENNRY